MRTIRVPAVLAGLLAGSVLTPLSAAQAADFDVQVEDFNFSPAELYVNAGDTVTWTWVGEQPHNVTPADPAAFEGSETQTEGTFSLTFDEVGDVDYYCSLHSDPDSLDGMVGKIRVLAAGEELPEPPPEPRDAPTRDAPRASDSIGAAISWAKLYPADGAPTVLLARNDLFADSVASGGVQGLLDAPLLLTNGAPAGKVNERVAAELERLGTTEVIILGGVNAVSAGVEEDLEARGYTVRRVFGQDRVDTAVQYAATFHPDARQALLVRGYGSDEGTQAFADSIGAGAAAARMAAPILLSTTEALSAATRDYLASSKIEEVFVIGGESALSAAVVSDLEELGITVSRVAGADRYETAAAILFDLFGESGVDALILVDGTTEDAWVAGSTAASVGESAPVMLVNGDVLPDTVIEIVGFGIPPICGPLTSEKACENARIANSARQLGEEGALLAVMNGANEVPGPGARDTASADAFVKQTDSPSALCFELQTYNLVSPVTAAHIHRGAAGVAGPPVVTLPVPSTEDGGNQFAASCSFDLDDSIVAEILANPAEFYVNYHTGANPDGAVRGQLFQPTIIGLAELSGDNEVPPVEVPGGGFIFTVTDAADHSMVCYYSGMGIEGDELTAMHVHQAPEGENGDVVITLNPPPGGEAGQCTDADASVVDAMLADPSAFYVNVHSEAHPDGALRGQLFNPYG